MEKFKVSFVASNQQLTATGTKHASDTYADIEATFALGERWTDMDSVSAVWWNDYTRIATPLDSEGKCTVPYEVLARKGCVRVNLVGSVVEGGELATRLTSYSAEAVHVNEKIKLTGNEPQSITPSQFEQFVENVRTDADRAESAKESAQDASASAQGYAQDASASATSASESATASEQAKDLAQGYAQNASESAQTAETAKDDAESARDEILGMRAEAVTLPAGSDATASYADGLLSLGIPRGNTGAKGDKGDTGETGATPNLTIGNVETLEPSEPATATITGTAENPVLNLGIPQGDTGEVSLSDLSTLLPTDTASGDIASFPDGQSVIPLLSLLADIEPIQSGTGTPSPDNVRPISGHTEVVTNVTGVNVWDEEWELGIWDISNGQKANNSANIRSKNLIPIAPNTQYCWNNSVSNVIRFCFYDVNREFISNLASTHNSPWVFTTPQNARYMTFYYGATTYEGTLSINYPSTDTDYHAYNGDTYTTALGQTVYGGTLDVVSGVLTVDRAMVDLGDATWNYNGTYSCWVTSAIADVVKKYPTQAEMITAIAEKYVVDPVGILNGANFTAGKFILGTSGNLFIKTGSDSETPTGAFVYELANPQTIQLTPQQVYALLGQNNVWADSGEVEVVYKADVTKWVEKRLS